MLFARFQTVWLQVPRTSSNFPIASVLPLPRKKMPSGCQPSCPTNHPPGTAQPLPRLQCQAESSHLSKSQQKGGADTKWYLRAHPVWDLLARPRTSDTPAQGIRNELSGSPGPAPGSALAPHLERSYFGSPLPPETGSGAARGGPVRTSNPTWRELRSRGGCWAVCAEPDFPLPSI